MHTSSALQTSKTVKVKQLQLARELPDMMPASEGDVGHGKADVDSINQFQMWTKGRGS